MKKIVIIGLIAALSINFGATFANAASSPDRTSEGLVSDFSEDFESYAVGNYIELTPGFDQKWSNNVLDKGESVGMDLHTVEKAKIVYENGTSGNKVMHLDNRVGQNSFFHISPKGDYRYKNFTVTFRIMMLDNTGWCSAVVRKDENTWYNSCNNVNATILVPEDGSCVTAIGYRNMPGAPDQPYKTTATIENDNYTYAVTPYTDDSGSYVGRWFDIKYVVNEKSYKLFVNDKLVMDLYTGAKKITTFGYVSFHGCCANVYFDDIRIENNDTVAPPSPDGEEEEGKSESESVSEAEESAVTSVEEPAGQGGCGGGISGAISCLFALFPLAIGALKRKTDN